MIELCSCSEAKLRGLKKFSNGKPCKKAGHVSERYVNNRGCVECAISKAKQYQIRNREKRLSEISKWQRANREKTRGYRKRCEEKNGDKYRQTSRTWSFINRDKVNRTTAKRRAFKLTATPNWLSDAQTIEIELKYLRAAVLTLTTSILHEVDHIVPLQGKEVCGLHVPWNLAAIPMVQNRRKSNSLVSDAQAQHNPNVRERPQVPRGVDQGGMCR